MLRQLLLRPKIHCLPPPLLLRLWRQVQISQPPTQLQKRSSDRTLQHFRWRLDTRTDVPPLCPHLLPAGSRSFHVGRVHLAGKTHLVHARWAEHCSSAVPFPFPTWAGFEAKFHLQSVEENEQNQALTKLESHSYFQGSHDIYWYTDNFEELAVTADYSDTLVRVTKYCSGLNLQINIAIMMSRTNPNLTNYDGWCVCAFWQYKVFSCTRTRNPPAQLPAPLPWPRTAGLFPAPVTDLVLGHPGIQICLSCHILYCATLHYDVISQGLMLARAVS
jgi:hypothetical protein